MHLDLLFAEDGHVHIVVRATDAVSGFQLAAVLPDRSSSSVINFVTRLLWPMLRAPRPVRIALFTASPCAGLVGLHSIDLDSIRSLIR